MSDVEVWPFVDGKVYEIYRRIRCVVCKSEIWVVVIQCCQEVVESAFCENMSSI